MDVWSKTRPKFLGNQVKSIDEQIDRLINDNVPSQCSDDPTSASLLSNGGFPCYPRFRAAAPGREAATRAAVTDRAVLAYWHPKNRITSPSPLMEKPARPGSLGATERIHDHRVSP
jgi:hypothetical protein